MHMDLIFYPFMWVNCTWIQFFDQNVEWHGIA